jgi:chromosome segregation protein
LAERSASLKAEAAQFTIQETSFRTNLLELEKGITNRNKTVLNKEKELKEKIGKLGVYQERCEKAQVTLAEAHAEIKNLYANFRERHSRDLKEFEHLQGELPLDAKLIREQASDLREELKNLGSVNLMAVEEFAEVKERYDFLHGQLEDLRKAREDLIQVTGEIRHESAQLFLDTYEQIRTNFHTLYRRLFGGGRGELRLSEPEKVLDSGIEIYAQPPGKKLENIALLSGGERSLTAVALLFATYMVKPSPFCLLDEIDAALDENNVSRFVSTLMDFAGHSQFIVITHNKKTVTGARSLLGVTMQESGVSKVVAIRIAEEERHSDYRRTNDPHHVEESRNA